jgi:Zn-dependent membrane protease YugP
MLDDPIFWLFTAPGLLLGFYAQSLIKANYVRYSQVPSPHGITGAEVARRVLDSQGLHNVMIESTPGVLSDHYDPRTKSLRLSQEVYYTPSIAAAGIAAHEAGHALQDADHYFPMKLRSYIVPAVQLSGKIAPLLFLGGYFLGLPQVAWVGVALFGINTLFTLMTLPVELDASKRAQNLLLSQHIVDGGEQTDGIKKVLTAAAWTYVAGAVSAIGSLLYFVTILFFRFRRRV